MNNNKV